MMEISDASTDVRVLPEIQFARVLENFQMSGGEASPFDLAQNFISIAAAQALEAGNRISYASDSGPSSQDTQEFVSWDLETKLWHLVSILYAFRLSDHPEIGECPAYASYSKKQQMFLDKQPKLQELILIIKWLQHNSQEVNVPSDPKYASKWENSRIALQNKDLTSLASMGSSDSPNSATEYVKELDDDAPLRSSAQIAPADLQVDSANFLVIYNLVLAGDYQRAVDYASQTGNFTLALILVGAQHDYIDPVLDEIDLERSEGDEDEDIEGGDILEEHQTEPSGIRQKYLWLQTVYNLSQEKRLPKEERLIYSYLSGGDQTENIRQAGAEWDNCLLLYVNQLLTYHCRSFMEKSLTSVGGDMESVANVTFPMPQHTSIENILNTMSKSRAVADESSNPFRVIMGSVLINQLNFFLDNTCKPSSNNIVEDQHILRVLVHLAIFSVLLGLHEGSKTPTKIITKYISRLAEFGYADLVPVYLMFIPDEKDVRECYSVFLTTITDPEQRAKQIEIFKRLGVNAPIDTPSSSEYGSEDLMDEREHKIHNVLKRTVERVMIETEAHYVPKSELKIEDDVVDDVDIKVLSAVEWFFENKMYEDAICATRTVFQRFLSTGHLKAIKQFGKKKNIKKLLKDFDFDLHTRSLGGSDVPTLVSEEHLEELTQYEKMLECLLLLDEWKTFHKNASNIHWKSNDVGNSIEKVVGKIQSFISTWFKESPAQENSILYREYRSIYIPYFIIELLQILYEARLHDWQYMRQAFQLVNEVANDKKNDFLRCFLSCGRISEFVVLSGEIAAVAAYSSTNPVF